MGSDYREFLRMLRMEPGRPTLFEPYPEKRIVSQLIWRNGDNLWDTTPHRVSTLIDLYAYIKADTVIIPSGSDIGEVLDCAPLLPEGMKFTILADDEAALAAADRSDAVCAIASAKKLYGADFAKPLIDMSDGSDIDGAIARGCSGVHVPCGIEQLWPQYGGRIPLLGGLGIDVINSTGPLSIHTRIRKLHELTRGCGWAVGSGRIHETEVNYLGFISMLGMYTTICNDVKYERTHIK